MNWRESWMFGDVWSTSRILQTVLFLRQTKAILLELGSVLPCACRYSMQMHLVLKHPCSPWKSENRQGPYQLCNDFWFLLLLEFLQWPLLVACFLETVMPSCLHDLVNRLLGLPYRREVGCGHSADEWIASWDCGGWHGWSLSYCVPLQP